MLEISDQEFADLVEQYMTDDERYEIECLETKEAIERFIKVYGAERWDEILSA